MAPNASFVSVPTCSFLFYHVTCCSLLVFWLQRRHLLSVCVLVLKLEFCIFIGLFYFYWIGWALMSDGEAVALMFIWIGYKFPVYHYCKMLFWTLRYSSYITSTCHQYSVHRISVLLWIWIIEYLGLTILLVFVVESGFLTLFVFYTGFTCFSYEQKCLQGTYCSRI